MQSVEEETNIIFYITDIANAWLETLLDVIDLLPKEVIKKDVSQTNSEHFAD